MIKLTVWYNTKCLSCGKIEKEMVKIGAFVMCKDCAISEFGKKFKPINRSSQRGSRYDDWLRISKRYS